MHVNRFFQQTFSLKQMRQNPTLARWRSETEMLINNTSFIPLSLSLHPVMVAAGYLAWARDQIFLASGGVASG